MKKIIGRSYRKEKERKELRDFISRKIDKLIEEREELSRSNRMQENKLSKLKECKKV